MTTPLRTGRRRKQRQRRLLWAIVFALVLPLAFMPFETWLEWVFIGVILAVPVLGFGVGLVDMIYGMSGGYDRHARRSRDRFAAIPPVSDDDIPANDPDVKPRHKRKKRVRKSMIAWITNSYFHIRPGGFR